MTDRTANPEALSYEQAREELIVIVLWERGEQLAAVCQAWLDGAKAKIDSARTKDKATAEET
jgi:exodeoxyribonuclease VII small subunit